MKINILKNKNIISLEAKKLSDFGKFTGLMFKTKNSQNLLFYFIKPTRTPIHSFFVFFKFLAVWMNDKNEIIETRVVKPFQTSIFPSKKFTKLIEIPLSEKNKILAKLLVGKGKI